MRHLLCITLNFRYQISNKFSLCSFRVIKHYNYKMELKSCQMRFEWKFPTDILSTKRWIVSDDIEFNGLKWRFYFHPKFFLSDEAAFKSHKALLMQLR